MGFLLPMFLIYCCCISSLETTYLPCVTEMRVFASTRDFLRSSITFSLVFTRSAISWPSLFSSSISHFFSYKSAVRSSFCVCSAWKDFLTRSWRWTSFEYSFSYIVCLWIFLDLSGSFSFAEEAEIGNRIFICRHCSCYKELNSAVWSGRLQIECTWELCDELMVCLPKCKS